MTCIMILMIIILYYQITYNVQWWTNTDVLTLCYTIVNVYHSIGRITLKNDTMVFCDYIVINDLLRLENMVNLHNIAGYFFCLKLTNNRIENASRAL